MFDSFFSESGTASHSLSHVLVVFSPKPRALKIDIFPLDGREVVKIQLKCEDFSIKTIDEIREITKELNLPDDIFVSGVCVKQKFCLYESYIEKKKLKIPIEEIKKRFQMAESIKQVQIYNVE